MVAWVRSLLLRFLSLLVPQNRLLLSHLCSASRFILSCHRQPSSSGYPGSEDPLDHRDHYHHDGGVNSRMSSVFSR